MCIQQLFVKLKPCKCFTENGEQLFHCLYAAITKIQEATYRWLYHKTTGWLDSVAHVHGIAQRRRWQHRSRLRPGQPVLPLFQGVIRALMKLYVWREGLSSCDRQMSSVLNFFDVGRTYVCVSQLPLFHYTSIILFGPMKMVLELQTSTTY